ncbi:MAG: zinc ribbon domain-containing protein [Clostridia bacterium]|nr:zinc ribbon domain-containing protein [Clostridia bacterium]
MDFLDDISRKIAQASQSAVQKTKDMSGIAKINSAISEEERKINNAYFQIGKMYASLHAADPEPNFAGLIAAIKEAEQNIVAFRNQIQDIKGIARCSKCGAEVGKNVAFCSSCGASMYAKEEIPPQPSIAFCTNCGAGLAEGVSFCTACGTKVE